MRTADCARAICSKDNASQFTTFRTPPQKKSDPHERVVLEVDLRVLVHHVCLGLALVGGAGHAGRHLAAAVGVDDDAVLGELLLDQDDLLGALRGGLF